jgi:putative endonuclease
MITVYAIFNSFNCEIYVGITGSFERRLIEHNSGKNRYTKAFMPWELYYSEECSDYSSARKREKYLKSAAGKRFMKKHVGSLFCFRPGIRYFHILFNFNSIAQ